MVRKYFGTDGIRGKANEGAMTAETALRVGMAAGRVIVGNGDAAARRARPGRLGIVGCGDARARRKKTASGCPRRQVCMRFREEETAPAIREENRAA
ncbi:TPA: hypothetical protein ND457_005168 [Escherichia coli]|nr:hypothetical protein [Escherichia coli]HCD7545111.1 hypothetical protein [Escherichia coli]